MSPSHPAAAGRIYRYYVTREAIADGYDTCPVTACRPPMSRARCSTTSRSCWPRRSWSRGPGRLPSEREDEITEREVPSCSPTSPRSGPSCSPPSRRGSSSSSSSGSTCRRTRWRFGSGPRAWRAWSASYGTRREESGMTRASRQGWTAPRWSSASHAFPAPRRPQAHRRAGRERARAGGEAAADGTLVKALARAWRWQRMLDEGVYTAVSEIGDAENISKSYVSRILRSRC